MEEEIQNHAKPYSLGVPYPIETVDEVLNNAKTIVEEYGTSRPISKEEISRILNKKVATLSLTFSTMVQYGIFSLIHGKGYIPSDLYRKYTEPVHENDEFKIKLKMFKSAPLYGKIIEHLNGHTLPSDVKRFSNLLKGDPYGVNQNSAERAAKVFFENCGILKLRDSAGRFKFPDSDNLPRAHDKPGGDHAQIRHTPPPNPELELFELPIPLPNKRKAYLKYPLENLTRKDITVISKALEFIASSLDEE
jgi:hypothetical protein